MKITDDKMEIILRNLMQARKCLNRVEETVGLQGKQRALQAFEEDKNGE